MHATLRVCARKLIVLHRIRDPQRPKQPARPANLELAARATAAADLEHAPARPAHRQRGGVDACQRAVDPRHHRGLDPHAVCARSVCPHQRVDSSA